MTSRWWWWWRFKLRQKGEGANLPRAGGPLEGRPALPGVAPARAELQCSRLPAGRELSQAAVLKVGSAGCWRGEASELGVQRGQNEGAVESRVCPGAWGRLQGVPGSNVSHFAVIPGVGERKGGPGKGGRGAEDG